MFETAFNGRPTARRYVPEELILESVRVVFCTEEVFDILQVQLTNFAKEFRRVCQAAAAW